MGQVELSFGPFTLTEEGLTRGDEPLAIGRRGLALVQALARADGPVSRMSLMEAGWPGVRVEESNLTVQIAALRRAMGRREDGQEWIATVSGFGYRLLRTPIKQPTEQAVSTPRLAIAVLPFANLSDDPEQQYFADGMVEDLITALSRFKTLSVAARSSSFSYRESVDVRDVAGKMGVRYVLTGSVRRASQRIRVTAQLIDAASGSHLWADKFDKPIDSVFDVQDQITESVVGLMEPQIRKAEIERARRKRPESLDAYDLYLRALPLVYASNMRGYSEAVILAERAVELDPGFAPALMLAAWAHEKRLTFEGRAPEGVDDKAAALALGRRALAADQDDPTVLAIVGWLFIYLAFDYEGGLALTNRALALNPNGLLVLHFAGLAHGYCGDLDKSIACHTKALEISPGAPDAYMNTTGLAIAHIYGGRFQEAIVWALRSLETYTEWELTYDSLAVAYAHLGRIGEAVAMARRRLVMRPDIPWIWGMDGPTMWGEDGPVPFPARMASWNEGMRIVDLALATAG